MVQRWKQGLQAWSESARGGWAPCKRSRSVHRASLLVPQSQVCLSGTWPKLLPGAESLLAQGSIDPAVFPALGDSGRSRSSGPVKIPVEFWTKLNFILGRSLWCELYQGRRIRFPPRVLSPQFSSAFPAILGASGAPGRTSRVGAHSRLHRRADSCPYLSRQGSH